jgi:serine protease Do
MIDAQQKATSLLNGMILAVILLVLGFAVGETCTILFNTNIESRHQAAQSLLCQSVMIDNGGGKGSGTLMVYDGDVYCWTASHVVRDSEEVTVKQSIYQVHGLAGFVHVQAKVVARSDEYDLALLKLEPPVYHPDSELRFASHAPKVGGKLIHIGCLHGEPGYNSYSEGHVSYLNRPSPPGIRATVLDQTTVMAYPGSSGGGVYNEHGEYVGMLVAGAGPGWNLMVPVRAIRQWCKEEGIEWACP